MSVPDTKAAPQPTEYNATMGTIRLLRRSLRQPMWYKDKPNEVELAGYAFEALKALPKHPEGTEEPQPRVGESQESFDARLEAWSSPTMQFIWLPQHHSTSAVCVKFFVKAGAFEISEHYIALLKLLALKD